MIAHTTQITAIALKAQPMIPNTRPAVANPLLVLFLRPNTCARPSYEGVLLMPSAGSKRWAERYCCLARDVLLVFGAACDPLPKAFVDLNGATIQLTKKPSHSWEVRLRDKIFPMATHSSDLRAAWIEALTVGINHSRKNPQEVVAYLR